MRRALLTTHIVVSVGWFGTVLSFLALGIAALEAPDADRAHAAYVAMDLTGWFIIVPLAFASLFTGLLEAFSTPWRLFQHYWIVMKLGITGLCTALLLVHMRPTGRLAGASVDTLLSSGDLQPLRLQLVTDSALALLALGVASVLAVYKPAGTTTAPMPLWFKALGAVGVAGLFIGHLFARHAMGAG